MALRRSLLMMPTVPGGLPDEYLQVEYIRAIPGTYINSGYVPTVAPRIETKIQIMNNSDSDLFGFEKMVFPAFIVDAANYGVAWYNRWGQTNSTWFSTQVKTPTDCVFGKTTVIGTREYPDAFGDTDWSSNAQVMYIGKGRNDTCDVSIYSCKLYDGTAIVRDMIPCIRIADGKPGMYDLVGRRFYTNAGTGEFLTGYIADGLVFHLDGIDRGGVSGQWKDIVGGRIATLTGTYTEDTNNIYFDGGYGTFNSEPSIGKDDGTIETAVELSAYEGTGRPIASFRNGYIGGSISSQSSTGYGGAMRWYGQSGTMEAWRFPADSLSLVMTASANSDRGICNGYNGEKIAISSWSSGSKLLAYRGSGNKFIGKMYAVRIYDRKLSAAEMLHNQRTDNIRFNLGLTI